jgi:uncharacterized protein (TIGR00106 family)
LNQQNNALWQENGAAASPCVSVLHDPVMAAIKRCHEVVHEMGAPRITTTIKIGTRTDREQTMEEKINSVNKKLAAPN